ncbi:2-dehydropantoate 2-reductase [Allosaccharopolyspora coralli]|uniref:2-dehydropantoate 2-reductase n=1 Tax=Allosaccharopolyspora coralli TaxID=2665642 RepID=A0A5Q3Q4H7_9PSEU|nr:2-dehydropantoate 2-reductase [Allosaccharopolyspora coralli]QGK69521.1 2-dehydropantoate 2-reductase [Allosaccharopolyspora coralli]
MTSRQTRIAVIGAGAIGGVLTAAAHDAGHAVTLCVRTPFDHFVIDRPGGTDEPAVRVATDPREIGEVDWILLTTKVQDVPGAARWLRALDNGRAPIVVVQNGIEHDESVAAFDLRGPVVPALIYVGAERVSPGHVVQHTPTSMIVPAAEHGTAFSDLFGPDGPTVRLTENFRTDAWRKLLTNLAANPITALTSRRLEVFDEDSIRELALAVLTEAVAAGRADGAELDDDEAESVLAACVEQFPRDAGTSMLYDRLAGRPTEHEHIIAPMVAAAEHHGIPAPHNRTLLALMRALRP